MITQTAPQSSGWKSDPFATENMRPLKNVSRFSGSQDQVEDPALCAGEDENFNHRNIMNIPRIEI